MNSHLRATLCAVVFAIVTNVAQAVVLPLEGRLPATLGGTDYQAYYDRNLNMTWAANADINGGDTWDNQVAWVANLSIGGISEWRLPSVDVNGDGMVVECDNGGVAGCSDNEMGFLYWEEGITSATQGPFSNINDFDLYWSSTDFPCSTEDCVWGFFFAEGFAGGSQGFVLTSTDQRAWAVHDGDVVPIPGAVWLFASGLLGLVGIARRKKAA